MSDKIDCKFIFAASSTDRIKFGDVSSGFMRRIKYYEEKEKKNEKGGQKHYGGTRKGTINKG